MLLDDYAAVDKQGIDPRSSHVIVTSAKTPASHLANKRNLLEWLRANESVNIQDVAYTTTARRMHHPIRFACTASTTRELMSKLEVDTSDALPSRSSPIVFVFTGQGSHYAGMGSELYATCRPFRETVDLCASICEQHNFPVFLDIIARRNVDMSTKDTIQTQLAVVTLEVSLAAFWRSCGIQPSMVIGHSLGEYAALHISGVLSLADMLYLVGHRARLLLERCEAGACTMLAVSASAIAIRELLSAKPHSSCTIACTNSPSATVVSGSIDDVAELRAALTSPSTTLPVPYGFHSFQVDPMLDDYIALAGGVTYSAPKIPVASTLLASIVDTSGVLNGLYLGQQTRQPVDFMGALNAVTTKLVDPIWLEVRPGLVCSSFVRATLSPSPGKVMSSLETSADAWVSISKCLASAYKNGISVDWLALQYGQRQNAANSRLTIRDVSLKRPLTRGLVGAEGELHTAALAENASGDSFRVSWKASSQKSSYDLGSCVVSMVDADKLQADWDRISYFAKARMNELTRTVKDGHGHRMLPGILYALFSNTVEYDPAFKCIKEAFISNNFEEAAADVILRNDPQETHFVASPYWGESLVHLAGFLVNGNPDRSAAKTTFMMDSFDSFEQTVDLEPGKPYFAYTRVSQRDKNTTSCDVYVFDAERLVMQWSALRFHEVSNEVLDRLLGSSTISSRVQDKIAAAATPSAERMSGTRELVPDEPMADSKKHSDAPKELSKRAEFTTSTVEENAASNTEVFEIILESISRGTGTKIADLTDDTVLVELGVSSIFNLICNLADFELGDRRRLYNGHRNRSPSQQQHKPGNTTFLHD